MTKIKQINYPSIFSAKLKRQNKLKTLKPKNAKKLYTYI